MKGILILLFLTFGTAGCMLVSSNVEVSKNKNNDLIESLLPPESLGKNLSLSQIITGKYQDQVHSFYVEVEVMEGRLVMASFTPVGVPLFVIEQVGAEVTLESLNGDSIPFSPLHVLSNFQIAIWPEATLEGEFRKLDMIVRGGPIYGYRKVWTNNGKLLVAVTYKLNANKFWDITIEHFNPPYLLEVKTFNAVEYN